MLFNGDIKYLNGKGGGQVEEVYSPSNPQTTIAHASNADNATNIIPDENGAVNPLGRKVDSVVGQHSIALGSNASASSPDTTAVGYSALADGVIATALGSDATASGNYATALGYGAKATSDYTIVLGNSKITSLQCQVQTISALSDSRVKEDVSLANTAQCLEDVNRLPVSRFKYKDFTGTHLDVHRTGFMADDVEKVFPKSVSKFDRTFPVLDEEGNPTYEQEVDEEGNPVIDEEGNPVMKERTFVLEDVKSIAMEMAIPTLWGAVQELTKRVESLEAELSLLKNG